MTLNETIRRAFVRAVMADVPTTDYGEQIRKVVVDDVVSRLPADVASIWKDARRRGWVNTVTMHFGPHAQYSVTVPCIGRSEKPSLSLTTHSTIERLLHDAEKQTKQHTELRRMLTATAASVRSTKQLAALLPEFEKYLPADTAKAQRELLPAVANVVAAFSKAGWPKGSEPPQVQP